MIFYYGIEGEGAQLRANRRSITSHPDIELNFPRLDIDYFEVLPATGINQETGIILSIPGFGDMANSEYQTSKLCPYLADKYNCVTVSINYFGIYRSTAVEIDIQFAEAMENIYGIPKQRWMEIKPESVYEEIIHIMHQKRVFSLDKRCQPKRITAKNEYQSFGFLPAVDCLSVLGDILLRYPQLNKRKIIAYGSSYGGYIALLCAKYAPHTFSVIIDNSGFSQTLLKHVVGREILEPDFKYTYVFDNQTFDISMAFNNPWTIIDSTSSFYFSDSCRMVRNLLIPKHWEKSDTRFYIFHSVVDSVASVDDKNYLVEILKKYKDVYYKKVESKDIDGKLFKKLEHAMDASLRELFDHVAYLDDDLSLAKKSEHTDFDDNKEIILECGNKAYVFNFNNNYTLKVNLVDLDSLYFNGKIRTDNYLEQSNLAQLLETLNEAFEYIGKELHEKRVASIFAVMQSTLEGISKVENTLIIQGNETIPEQLLNFSNDLSLALAQVVDRFQEENWDSAEYIMAISVLPCFQAWRESINQYLRLSQL